MKATASLILLYLSGSRTQAHVDLKQVLFEKAVAPSPTPRAEQSTLLDHFTGPRAKRPVNAAVQSGPIPAGESVPNAAAPSVPSPAAQSVPQPGSAAAQSVPQPAKGHSVSQPDSATAQTVPQPTKGHSVPQPGSAAALSVPQPAKDHSVPQPVNAAAESAPQRRQTPAASTLAPPAASAQPAVPSGMFVPNSPPFRRSELGRPPMSPDRAICEALMDHWLAAGKCPSFDSFRPGRKAGWLSNGGGLGELYPQDCLSQKSYLMSSLRRIYHTFDGGIALLERVDKLPNHQFKIFGVRVETLPLFSGLSGRARQLRGVVIDLWRDYVVKSPYFLARFIHGLLDEMKGAEPRQFALGFYFSIFGHSNWGFVSFLCALWICWTILNRAHDIRDQREWNNAHQTAISRLLESINQLEVKTTAELKRSFVYCETTVKEVRSEIERQRYNGSVEPQDLEHDVRDVRMGRYVARYVSSIVYLYSEKLRRLLDPTGEKVTPFPKLWTTIDDMSNTAMPAIDNEAFDNFVAEAKQLNVELTDKDLQLLHPQCRLNFDGLAPLSQKVLCTSDGKRHEANLLIAEIEQQDQPVGFSNPPRAEWMDMMEAMQYEMREMAKKTAPTLQFDESPLLGLIEELSEKMDIQSCFMAENSLRLGHIELVTLGVIKDVCKYNVKTVPGARDMYYQADNLEHAFKSVLCDEQNVTIISDYLAQLSSERNFVVERLRDTIEGFKQRPGSQYQGRFLDGSTRLYGEDSFEQASEEDRVSDRMSERLTDRTSERTRSDRPREPSERKASERPSKPDIQVSANQPSAGHHREGFDDQPFMQWEIDQSEATELQEEKHVVPAQSPPNPSWDSYIHLEQPGLPHQPTVEQPLTVDVSSGVPSNDFVPQNKQFEAAHLGKQPDMLFFTRPEAAFFTQSSAEQAIGQHGTGQQNHEALAAMGDSRRGGGDANAALSLLTELSSSEDLEGGAPMKETPAPECSTHTETQRFTESLGVMEGDAAAQGDPLRWMTASPLDRPPLNLVHMVFQPPTGLPVPPPTGLPVPPPPVVPHSNFYANSPVLSPPTFVNLASPRMPGGGPPGQRDPPAPLLRKARPTNRPVRKEIEALDNPFGNSAAVPPQTQFGSQPANRNGEPSLVGSPPAMRSSSAPLRTPPPSPARSSHPFFGFDRCSLVARGASELPLTPFPPFLSDSQSSHNSAPSETNKEEETSQKSSWIASLRLGFRPAKRNQIRLGFHPLGQPPAQGSDR